MMKGDYRNSALLNLNCRELTSDWSGHLSIDNGKISAELFRFDCQKPYLSTGQRVPLILETGKYATLGNCIPAHAGTLTTATTRINHLSVNAGCLFLGAREWLETDKISIFEFCLPDARNALGYWEHSDVEFEGEDENFIQIHRITESKKEVFRIEGNGYRVIFSKNPSVPIESKDEIGDYPTWISVHYDTPCSLPEAFQIPFYIQTFFELSQAQPIRRMGVAIKASTSGSDKSDHEFYLHNFEFYESWRPSEYSESTNSNHTTIFDVFNLGRRQITKNALSIWLNRREDWKVTYWLASQFVRSANVTDRGKLLKAMAWFESIPDYKIDLNVTKNALKKFREDCTGLNSFRELRVSEKRLSQVLNELKRPPLIERLEEAIEDISNHFGNDLFENSLKGDCALAKKFRDAVAHGLHIKEEENFREFVIATAAITTVALLTTIGKLCSDKKHMHSLSNRFSPHPFINYQVWADSRSDADD